MAGKAQQSIIDRVQRSALRIHYGPAIWPNGDNFPATAVHEVKRGLNDFSPRLVAIRQAIKAVERLPRRCGRTVFRSHVLLPQSPPGRGAVKLRVEQVSQTEQ